MTIDLFKFSASPHEAETNFQLFCKEFKKNHHRDFSVKEDLHNFLKIFGNSNFLSHYAINNTWVFEQHQSSDFTDKEKTLGHYQHEIKTIVSAHQEATSILKKYKYQEFLRLTIKELLGLDQQITYRELSHLAFALTEHFLKKNFNALTHKYKLKPSDVCDFSLMALGKLGGLELNYSSDIDLIALYEEDKKQDNISNHEFFTKLFSQTGRDLSHMDQEGFFYRVDWDLRPEGKTGPLTNSLSALERYYQTFGEEWERQAYIKANVIYQNKILGDTFLKMLSPFVFRKYFDAKTIKNIWNMKSRIEKEHKQRSIDGISVKLDNGGIRDIEFFVQGFQLIYAGKTKDLQEKNTINAINKLAQHKLINNQTKNILQQSYLFLRRLESCLQMENEQQTHILKQNKEHKLKVARRMGFVHDNHNAISILEERLLNVRSSVKRIFNETYEP